MQNRNCFALAVIPVLIAGCGGGGGDSAVSNSSTCSDFQYQEDAQENYHEGLDSGNGIACASLPSRATNNTPTPAPSPEPSPAPAPEPAPTPTPTPTPQPAPAPTPGPQPSPTPTPSPAEIVLAGGYPTVQMQCSVGTPMKLARQWEINYNGGVIRFTPAGESEQVVIWQTSNMTTQQHSSSATFSAPTTDGRQAWLNVSSDGKINGGGYHGATEDSYLRCGAAQNGVERIGLQSKEIACRSGARLDENGNPDIDAEVQYTYETARIEYDFSVYPFKSLVNLTHPEYSLGDYNADQHGITPGESFNGAPATQIFYRDVRANPPYYYFVNEELVGATAGGRLSFQTGWECGNF